MRSSISGRSILSWGACDQIASHSGSKLSENSRERLLSMLPLGFAVDALYAGITLEA
jgi:hypothetical protein